MQDAVEIVSRFPFPVYVALHSRVVNGDFGSNDRTIQA
jgi:hypothetical protein